MPERYHDILASVAAEMGVSYKPPVHAKPRPKRTAAFSKNGTTEKVLRCVPRSRDRAATINELAYKSGKPRVSVRDAVNLLLVRGLIARERQTESVRSPYRYYWSPRAAGLSPSRLREIYRLLHRLRGHWVWPQTIRAELGLPKKFTLGGYLRRLHDLGAIDWHQMNHRYQVRWVRKVDDFGF